MSSSHLPYVPLNKQEGIDLNKAVNRAPISSKSNRTSCDILRRYPNGKLDIEYAAQKIIDTILQIKDMNQGGPSGWPLTPPQKALLSILMPGLIPDMPRGVAHTMLRISPAETALIALRVKNWMNEMANWSAGFGGGGRGGTIDKSVDADVDESEEANKGLWAATAMMTTARMKKKEKQKKGDKEESQRKFDMGPSMPRIYKKNKDDPEPTLVPGYKSLMERIHKLTKACDKAALSEENMDLKKKMKKASGKGPDLPTTAGPKGNMAGPKGSAADVAQHRQMTHGIQRYNQARHDIGLDREKDRAVEAAGGLEALKEGHRPPAGPKSALGHKSLVERTYEPAKDVAEKALKWDAYGANPKTGEPNQYSAKTSTGHYNINARPGGGGYELGHYKREGLFARTSRLQREQANPSLPRGSARKMLGTHDSVEEAKAHAERHLRGDFAEKALDDKGTWTRRLNMQARDAQARRETASRERTLSHFGADSAKDRAVADVGGIAGLKEGYQPPAGPKPTPTEAARNAARNTARSAGRDVGTHVAARTGYQAYTANQASRSAPAERPQTTATPTAPRPSSSGSSRRRSSAPSGRTGFSAASMHRPLQRALDNLEALLEKGDKRTGRHPMDVFDETGKPVKKSERE